MQAAKDTFYVTLRDGILATNPQRVMVVRGVQRAAVLVEENELPMGVPPADAFRMRWTEVTVDRSGTIPLAKLRCEVLYETAGSVMNGALLQGGMDRGRGLAAMDLELLTVLCGGAQSAAKMDFTSGTATPTGSQIYWADPVLEAQVVRGERVCRTAVVDVWSLEAVGLAEGVEGGGTA